MAVSILVMPELLQSGTFWQMLARAATMAGRQVDHLCGVEHAHSSGAVAARARCVDGRWMRSGKAGGHSAGRDVGFTKAGYLAADPAHQRSDVQRAHADGGGQLVPDQSKRWSCLWGDG